MLPPLSVEEQDLLTQARLITRVEILEHSRSRQQALAASAARVGTAGLAMVAMAVPIAVAVVRLMPMAVSMALFDPVASIAESTVPSSIVVRSPC
ncbi:hypothetical protein N7486_001627 [Penicillium sp. IBT 16267x]|nr:hypothetical protein N7486_001627 [Penicillium sp. IBT 16267x]